jgi:hypothetical protein
MKRYRSSQLLPQRNILILVSIACLSLGMLGAVVAFGWLSLNPTLDTDTAVLNAPGDQFLSNHSLLVRVVSLVVATVALSLSFSWLRLQFPRRRHQDDLTFASRSVSLSSAEAHGPVITAGSSLVRGDALAQAFENDLRHSPAIHRAQAELRIGRRVIQLRLDVDDQADVAELYHNAIQAAVERLNLVASFQPPPHLVTDIRLVGPHK